MSSLLPHPGGFRARCEVREALVLPPTYGLGWALMRAMFVIYFVGITAGLVYFTTIGLLHH